ncbi:3'-5' exoribonuclease YhaM family protein [Opitutus terrae]|uniref:Metal dependent phosphohydrolase n=1 Tax=Opitutus terrae (strain DSM 11246 / JCM 15787 / PB90-1) TaxID=452637 RepID=B1ZZG4_OPITP|nr:HD domain-containing protein [Opitutus terrae]ACB76367.1 metal dependent phosphohydrolase [Opitutus terrae PB90-1]
MSDDLCLSCIRDLKHFTTSDNGRTFSSLVVIKKLAAKTASNGNTFYSVEIGDRTGSCSCTVFGDSPVFEVLKSGGEGAVIRVEGKIDFYQGRLSPKLARASVLSEEELGAPGLLDSLVEVAPENPEGLWAEISAFIDGIAQPELRATVRGVFDEIGDSFRWAPAAVSMHHAYRHGLLEHTTHMARACRALLPLYPEVDPDLAMAGILLHDTGKTIEYEGTLATKRSRRGILQGHVVLGYQLARKAAMKAKLPADLLERLEHIILSHQGEPEWGAAVYAATPEAVFVSMIDNLDAKMGMVQRALRQSNETDEFSERLPGLNGPLLTKKIPR